MLPQSAGLVIVSETACIPGSISGLKLRVTLGMMSNKL
jgi:hypothetical protein